MDLIIDERVLDDFIEIVGPDSEYNLKGIYNFLKEVRQLGYLHNLEHRIVLVRKTLCAELNEEYAKYLDKRASGLKVKWVDDDESSSV